MTPDAIPDAAVEASCIEAIGGSAALWQATHEENKADYRRHIRRLLTAALPHLAPAASRSIPAAAALLREAGWTVEEPRCEMCGGKRVVLQNDALVNCPTCNGTGARP